MTCNHGPPDRLDGEPPSVCRACRRERYRSTSTRPRRQDRDDKRNFTCRLSPAVLDRIRDYAHGQGVSMSRATEDLVAVGLASELVDQALEAVGPAWDRRAS